jgi:hypothetical protein
MAMKMTIEYEIFGRETFIAREVSDNEEVIQAAEKTAEYQLRAEGVFGEITHQIEGRDEIYPFVSLLSRGKKFLREVKDGD